MKYSHCIKGFTLTELLVSLSVLGLIAALTMPSVFNSYKTMQKKAAGRETITSLEEALRSLYFNDKLPLIYENVPDVGNPYLTALLSTLNVKKICDKNEMAPPCDTAFVSGTDGRVRLIMHNGAAISVGALWWYPGPGGHGKARFTIDLNGGEGPNSLYGGANSDQFGVEFNISGGDRTVNGHPWKDGSLATDGHSSSKQTYDWIFE
jgi:prepilin-type N-terminal cleavage/methylation domain-containing protein